MRILLNNKIIVSLILIVFSLSFIFAGDVIVKEGSLSIDNNLNSSGVLYINGTSGNVGIGTTRSDYKLEVVDVEKALNVSGVLYVNGSSRRVGIGTTAPTYQLDVNGSVLGISTFFGGFGVQGWANGNQSNAIYGYNLGISGRAVYGQSAGTNGVGVYAYGYGANGYDFYGAKGKNYFAGNVGIKTTSPLYPLVVNSNTSETNQSISAWFSQNISASGFIDRTSVYDKSKGSAWNYIKDSSEYLNLDGTINHANFYGYVSGLKDYDYSKPLLNEETRETSYPIVEIGGVDLGSEIAVLRQALYEQKLINNQYKQALCSLNPQLDLCG